MLNHFAHSYIIFLSQLCCTTYKSIITISLCALNNNQLLLLFKTVFPEKNEYEYSIFVYNVIRKVKFCMGMEKNYFSGVRVILATKTNNHALLFWGVFTPLFKRVLFGVWSCTFCSAEQVAIYSKPSLGHTANYIFFYFFLPKSCSQPIFQTYFNKNQCILRQSVRSNVQIIKTSCWFSE